MKTVLLMSCLVLSDAHGQTVPRHASGGDSADAFNPHSLQLAKRYQEYYAYALCGRKVRDVFPTKTWGNQVGIEYATANGVDGSKVFHYLMKVMMPITDPKSEMAFLSYEKMKELVIDNPIQIDSRIVITFRSDHSVLASKYIVLNIDSKKGLAHFKYGGGEAILQLESRND